MSKFVLWGGRWGYPSPSLIKNVILDSDVVAITSDDNINGFVEGIPFVPKERISGIEFDFIVVYDDQGMGKVCNELKKLGIGTEKIISYKVLQLHGFEWSKYLALRKSNLSIIAPNCMGSYLCHLFSLPFNSPTINLWFEENGYMKMLKDLYKYMHSDISFYNISYANNAKDPMIYPIYRIDGDMDILIHMNHYPYFNDAYKKWNERRNRINWDNMIVMMYTERKDVLQDFDKLPFEKKVCFVPFRSNLKSAWYFPSDYRNFTETRGDNYLNHVLRICDGTFVSYDLWDMLLYGKKTPLLSML